VRSVPVGKRERRSLLPLPVWALVALAAGLALVTCSRILLSFAIKGISEPFPTILAGEALRWGLWLPVVPAAILLDRRWGIGAKPLAVALGMHACAAVTTLLMHTMIMTWVGQAAGWYFALDTATNTALIRLVHDGAAGVLVYAAIVSADHVRTHLAEQARRSVAEASLEARLARERLRNLQMQLHPHFIFNALHAVGGLIREGDRDTAIETVSGLGDLLRRVLRYSDRQEVTLDEEIEFLDAYLKIQKARYGAMLNVCLSVPVSLRRALIPHFLLQPLVENAIIHGVARRPEAGRIRIAAEARDGRLLVEIADNGPGLPSEKANEGVGLRNTRERLAELYGRDCAFNLCRLVNGGTLVGIDIPLRESGAEAVLG
jgi:two-component system, LytTR family, sensor kinase